MFYVKMESENAPAELCSAADAEANFFTLIAGPFTERKRAEGLVHALNVAWNEAQTTAAFDQLDGARTLMRDLALACGWTDADVYLNLKGWVDNVTTIPAFFHTAYSDDRYGCTRQNLLTRGYGEGAYVNLAGVSEIHSTEEAQAFAALMEIAVYLLKTETPQSVPVLTLTPQRLDDPISPHLDELRAAVRDMRIQFDEALHIHLYYDEDGDQVWLPGPVSRPLFSVCYDLGAAAWDVIDWAGHIPDTLRDVLTNDYWQRVHDGLPCASEPPRWAGSNPNDEIPF